MVQPANAFDELELVEDGAAPKHHIAVADQLDSSQAFADWSRLDVEGLARYVQVYRVDPDQVIFEEGTPAAGFCIVLDGKVGIYKQDEQGQSKQISVVRPGRFIGEMSVIDGGTYSATATAVETVTLLVVSCERFEQLIKDIPTLGNRLLRKLARLISMRLRQTTGVLIDYI